MQTLKMPYILHVAKIIYFKIFEIKKNNPSFSNIDAIDNFMGSNTYEEIRKGIFTNQETSECKRTSADRNSFCEKNKRMGRSGISD